MHESIEHLDFKPVSGANRRGMDEMPDQRIGHLDMKPDDPELKRGLEKMSWHGSPEEAEEAAIHQAQPAERSDARQREDAMKAEILRNLREILPDVDSGHVTKETFEEAVFDAWSVGYRYGQKDPESNFLDKFGFKDPRADKK